jgi:hypothetical protein
MALKSILISAEDLDFLLDSNWHVFNTLIKNCYCTNCKRHDRTIINYSIKLNDLQDVELEGFCENCGHKVGRYLEFGERPEFAERARAFKATRNMLKQSPGIKSPIPQRPQPFSKNDKQIMRKLIDKGLNEEYTRALKEANNILKKWNNQHLDVKKAYMDLFQSLKKNDKQIAFRYDGLTGSRYLQTLAIQLADGVISEKDLAGLSEEVEAKIKLFADNLKR